MFVEALLTLALATSPVRGFSSTQILASRSFSMANRYPNSYVNDIFRDNMLLTLRYLDGEVRKGDKISWDNVNRPYHYEVILKPGEGFAFHDVLLPAYKGKIVKSTNAHFNAQEGFKSDGFLFGDGVCHLASLIYWVAKDAGLETNTPPDHNFRPIPDVPKEYGVAIYVRPDTQEGAYSNLYVINSKDREVKFVFDYKDNVLKLDLLEG